MFTIANQSQMGWLQPQVCGVARTGQVPVLASARNNVARSRCARAADAGYGALEQRSRLAEGHCFATLKKDGRNTAP